MWFKLEVWHVYVSRMDLLVNSGTYDPCMVPVQRAPMYHNPSDIPGMPLHPAPNAKTHTYTAHIPQSTQTVHTHSHPSSPNLFGTKDLAT